MGTDCRRPATLPREWRATEMLTRNRRLLYGLVSVSLAVISLVSGFQLLQDDLYAQNNCNTFLTGCYDPAGGSNPCASTTGCTDISQVVNGYAPILCSTNSTDCSNPSIPAYAFQSTAATGPWYNCSQDLDYGECDDSCLVCSNAYLYSGTAPSGCTANNLCNSVSWYGCGASVGSACGD